MPPNSLFICCLYLPVTITTVFPVQTHWIFVQILFVGFSINLLSVMTASWTYWLFPPPRYIPVKSSFLHSFIHYLFSIDVDKEWWQGVFLSYSLPYLDILYQSSFQPNIYSLLTVKFIYYSLVSVVNAYIFKISNSFSQATESNVFSISIKPIKSDLCSLYSFSIIFLSPRMASLVLQLDWNPDFSLHIFYYIWLSLKTLKHVWPISKYSAPHIFLLLFSWVLL